jgi:hypothetical protein
MDKSTITIFSSFKFYFDGGFTHPTRYRTSQL